MWQALNYVCFQNSRRSGRKSRSSSSWLWATVSMPIPRWDGQTSERRVTKKCTARHEPTSSLSPLPLDHRSPRNPRRVANQRMEKVLIDPYSPSTPSLESCYGTSFSSSPVVSFIVLYALEFECEQDVVGAWLAHAFLEFSFHAPNSLTRSCVSCRGGRVLLSSRTVHYSYGHSLSM